GRHSSSRPAVELRGGRRGWGVRATRVLASRASGTVTVAGRKPAFVRRSWSVPSARGRVRVSGVLPRAVPVRPSTTAASFGCDSIRSETVTGAGGTAGAAGATGGEAAGAGKGRTMVRASGAGGAFGVAGAGDRPDQSAAAVTTTARAAAPSASQRTAERRGPEAGPSFTTRVTTE